MWGVGTRLATAYDQPALGGVYKLAALRDEQGQWDHKLKLSEQPVKTSTPGVQQIRRFSQRDRWVGDMIFDELTGVAVPAEVILADGRGVRIPPGSLANDLLCPVLRAVSGCMRFRPFTSRGSGRWSRVRNCGAR